MKESVIYFHRDGKPGLRSSMTPEKKKELTRKLRDENIRMAEERGLRLTKPDKVNDLGLSVSDIRRKLRRNNGQKDNG